MVGRLKVIALIVIGVLLILMWVMRLMMGKRIESQAELICNIFKEIGDCNSDENNSIATSLKGAREEVNSKKTPGESDREVYISKLNVKSAKQKKEDNVK